MRTAKLAIDPLWPQTATQRAVNNFAQRKRPTLRCSNDANIRLRHRANSTSSHSNTAPDAFDRFDGLGATRTQVGELRNNKRADAAHGDESTAQRQQQRQESEREATQALLTQPTPYLYTRLRTLAYGGKTRECRELAEYIVKTRREKPSTQLYSALILSNTSHDNGGAWRVLEYLEEMREAGLQPDTGTCHAVLKVLAVHPDHLLRADILEYMRIRWYQLGEEGAHDVAAGLLREGLFEQAMQRIDGMLRAGVRVQAWLLDMAVYMLCAAGEVEESYRIMRQRYDTGELNMSRTLWYTLLDTGSSRRHHASTALVWNGQVNTSYLNPASGVCLNVLTTVAQAGDAVLATDVFTHLSKRGTSFTPIHYQLLIDCYLAADPPDLKRALSILTIMALEKMADPSPAETRSLYLHLRSNPALVAEAFTILRDLHAEERKVPIAALNLIIECYVEQRNLTEAMNVYKLIHTFVPTSQAATGKRTFANTETFNLLLRGCRLADPPDEALASFLVSELLALRVIPTSLTYDRLILVFVQAGAHALEKVSRLPDPEEAQAQRKKGLELLDWAFRHFVDMQAVSDPTTTNTATADNNNTALGWMPRFGTVERLALQLAKVGDGRCWDVLQAGEDHGAKGGLDLAWDRKGGWVRKNVEEAWSGAVGGDGAVAESPGVVDVGVADA
ncbi:hypothetical protein LTR35_011037 [Friedmanniomyces endolithicus]|uniref:Pentatricopeptide repeat-containing protein-mitochondrial domain-containing protein n=1 Tax=Friedmanniomyces endolithicus TaxID=329885 RepID=A0AAN6F701_9PEZI|nr:hypothetical protein LTR35_011037 [Friedmanniomyces endolithicus]KAK0293972.1 hypothetical protein LTS00_007311 [Friedmanniomyces endolithicus]KAK0304304.1 hypothetical protein LTR82_017250 [Friedmanniomyces endolithicus]KAK0992006.1 hypothetical protein LTR54_011512 [Friedmanniomyces endolithicus]